MAILACSTATTTLTAWNSIKAVTAAGTIDATLGASYTPTHADERVLIILTGGAAESTVTITLPTGGIQGTQTLEMVLAISTSYAVQLESGKYKSASGSAAGTILFTADVADATIQIFELLA